MYVRERALALTKLFTQVYNNFNAPREYIEEYLRKHEHNEDLRTLPVAHKAGLDFLYQRVAYVTTHPVAALWWIFFHDLWDVSFLCCLLLLLLHQLLLTL